jgi:MoxR-like ATPase
VRAGAAVEVIFESDIPNSIKQAIESTLQEASRIDPRMTRLWTSALAKSEPSEIRAASLANSSEPLVRLTGINMLRRLAEQGATLDTSGLVTILREALANTDVDTVRAAVELAIVAQMPAADRRDIGELARNVMSRGDSTGTTIEVLDPRRVAEIYRLAGASVADIANFFKSCFGGLSTLPQHLAAIEAVPTLAPDSRLTGSILDNAISAYPGSLGAICASIDKLALESAQIQEYVDAALALATDPAKALVDNYGKTLDEASSAGPDIGRYVAEGLLAAVGRGALPETVAKTVFDAMHTGSPELKREILRVAGSLAANAPSLAETIEAFVNESIASADPETRTAAIYASCELHGGELAESDVLGLARDPRTASAVPALLASTKLDATACKRVVDAALQQGEAVRIEIARSLADLPLAKADTTKLAKQLATDEASDVVLAFLETPSTSLLDASTYKTLLTHSDLAIQATALAHAPITAKERAARFDALCKTERDPRVVGALLNTLGAVSDAEATGLADIIRTYGQDPPPGVESIYDPIILARDKMLISASAAPRVALAFNEAPQDHIVAVAAPTPSTVQSATTQEQLAALHDVFTTSSGAATIVRAHLRKALATAPAVTTHDVLSKAIELDQNGKPSLSAIEARRRALSGDDFDPKTMVEVEGVWLPRNLEKASGPVPSLAEESLVDCVKTRSNRRTVAEAWAMRVPLWLEGPSSAGKTAIIRELCAHTETVFRRFNCNPYTDVQEMLGRMVPNADDPTNGHFEPGPIVQAMINGECLLLDEMDLANPTVRSRINGLLDARGKLCIQGFNGGKPFKPHPSFRIFACTNGTSVVGRQKSDPAFLDRWVRVPVEGLDKADITQICEHKFSGKIPAKRLAEVIDFHMAMASAAETKLIGGREAEYSFTLRNMFRVLQRFVRYAGTSKEQKYQQVIMRREAEEIYLEGMVEERDRKFVGDELNIRFSGATADDVKQSRGFKPNPAMPGTILVEKTADGHKLGDASIKRLDCCTENIPAFERPYIITERVAKVLYQLFKAVENHENVLLVGEKGCGKTTIAEYLAHLRNQTFRDQVFDATSDPSTMIGNYGPMGWQDAFLTDAVRNRGIALADELNTAPPPVVERPKRPPRWREAFLRHRAERQRSHRRTTGIHVHRSGESSDLSGAVSLLARPDEPSHRHQRAGARHRRAQDHGSVARQAREHPHLAHQRHGRPAELGERRCHQEEARYCGHAGEDPRHAQRRAILAVPAHLRTDAHGASTQRWWHAPEQSRGSAARVRRRNRHGLSHDRPRTAAGARKSAGNHQRRGDAVKITPSAHVRYRGTATPTPIDSKNAKPLAIPLGPTPAKNAERSVGIPAAQVLSGTLSKWTDRGVDGPGSPQRCMPTVAFPGLELVDRISLDGKAGIDALSLLSGGRIIIPGHESFGRDYIVSAKIDSRGKLKFVNAHNVGKIAHGTVYEASPNRVVFECYGDVKTAAIAADGTLAHATTVEGVPLTCHLAQLSPGVFIAAGTHALAAFSVDDNGKATILAQARTDLIGATTDTPAVYRGNIVLRTRNEIRTYVRRGDTFVQIDSAGKFEGDTPKMPLSIGRDGVFAVTNDKRDYIYTFRVSDEGHLTTRAPIHTTDGVSLSPIVFNNLLITKDNWNNVRSYLLDDALKPTHIDKAGSAVVGRPTITRDGVVLTGDTMGKIAAFKLDAFGKFTELPGYRDGHQVLAPIAVTSNGYVLACVDDDLVSLRKVSP